MGDLQSKRGRDWGHNQSRTKENVLVSESVTYNKRPTTVYDVVVGRIGTSGFLSLEQQQSGSIHPLAPGTLLEQRNHVSTDDYDADKGLNKKKQHLPDSNLLKDIHQYVSDFYELTSGTTFDFHSLDETALLAMGILVEEACQEALGTAGDLVFTEAASRDKRPTTGTTSRHQIIGRVIPNKVQEYQDLSESEDSEAENKKTRKRQRRRYRSPEE